MTLEPDFKELECTCELNPNKCPYPLHSALLEETHRKFGTFSGSYGEPMYIVALDGDAKVKIHIVDIKTSRDTVEELHPIEPIFGGVNLEDTDPQTGEEFYIWWEPIVGLGICYQRDVRYAYICDKDDDQAITAADIYIQEIYAGDGTYEAISAHRDTTLLPFKGY